MSSSPSGMGAARRAAYVQTLQDARAIRSTAVARAFARVDRRCFVDTIWVVDETGRRHARRLSAEPEDVAQELVYADTVFFTCVDASGWPLSSSTRPSLMARMLERLELEPRMKVLEIGTGTGYNAALIAEIIGAGELVTTVDVHPEVIDQTRLALLRAGYGAIDVSCRDGAEGCPQRAPFDRIVSTVCCSDVSPRWAEQLSAGGLMLIPLQHGGPNMAWLMRLSSTGEGLVGRVAAPCRFMSMQGVMSSEHPWMPEVRRSGLPTARRGPGLTDDADLEDFYYFLGLEDARTCRLVEGGAGLWDHGRGFAFSTLDEEMRPITLQYGDDTLRDELLRQFERWSEELGRPRAADFESELRPVSSPTRAPALRKEGDAWVIERQFFEQRVRLRPYGRAG